MRRFVWIALLLVTGWMAGDHPMSAQQNPADPCPLKWRKDPAAAAQAREAKKQRMRRNGVPERYLHLLDRMECVACIETAPDTLHITVLYNDDEHAPTLSDGRRDLKVEFKWNPQSERQLREELRNGEIRAFYVWIHEKRCTCCPDFDKKAESFADWDDDVGANMDETEQYDDPDDLGPLPDDLKPPPPGTQTPPPPIERFEEMKPRQRYVHVTCPACQPLADQWNQESSNLNFLWDRKIEQMRRVSVIANARGTRQNEIDNLEYQQRFDSTRSFGQLEKIRELKKINESQEADQDAAEREIERLDGEIAATEMRMEALLQKILECEKSCRKTTTADPTGVASTTVNELPPAYYAGLPVSTTATLTPSLRLDPIIPQPPSTFVPPNLTLNATAGDVARPQPPASTVIVPIEPGAMTTAGLPAANVTSRSADPQRPTVCPPCQVLAEFVQRAANDVAAAQATLDNIRANIALLTKALQGLDPKEPRALSIAGQLQQLAAAQTPAEVQLSVLEQVRRALEGQLTACQQKCTDPAGGGVGQTGTANATGTGGASPKPAPAMAHPDEKLAITDRKLIVSKCLTCDPIAKLLNEAFDRAEAHSRKVSDWHTHHDIVNNEVRRNAEETRRMQQQFERTGDQAFADRVTQLNQQTNTAVMEITEAFVKLLENRRILIAEINGLWAQLQACNQACAETTSTSTNTTGNTSAGAVSNTDTCSGAACSEEWNACTATNSCPPIDRDCRVPATCGNGGDPTTPGYNLADLIGSSPAANAEVETRIQIKIGDVVFDVVVQAVNRQGIKEWFNPVGLLAKRLRDNLERWHGSVGPRPLVNPRDLKLVEKYTDGQNIGLPKGLHVLLTDRGGSTGRTLGMQVLNLTGQPVRLASMPFVIEPIRQQAQQRVQQAFTRLANAAPVNIDLAAYCVEFLKLPPSANQIFRLAPEGLQKKYEAMSKILRSAYRVQTAGLLRPDSNPAAYADSIKQWAVWAVEQKLNEKSFTEAFLGHTKKNVEAAGQQWSRPAEDMVRKVSPNRWRDIVRVLQGAGLPVPQ